MRASPTRTWLIFVACVAPVLAGLGWMTWHSLRLERSERRARSEAKLQEMTRLALWRMDSLLVPIFAQEAARPYFHYQAFYPAERAYTRMWEAVLPGEVLVPSPLLQSPGRFARLHFQVSPDGVVTSPQAPAGNMRDLAEASYSTPERIIEAERLLASFRRIVGGVGAGGEMGERAGDRLAYDLFPESQMDDEAGAALGQHLQLGEPAGAAPEGQPFALADEKEYQARQQAADFARNVNEPQSAQASPPSVAPQEQRPAPADDRAASPPSPEQALTEKRGAGTPGAGRARRVPDSTEEKPDDARPRAAGREIHTLSAAEVRQEGFTPTWRIDPLDDGPELLVSRRVWLDERPSTQGLWMDWPALERWLLDAVADLLPQARLLPITEGAGPSDEAARGRLLANIPVALLPGTVPLAIAPDATPAHLPLLITWGAAVAAIGSIALVLRAAIELGERRGRFVSAVTHELRTPLTTFRLYAQMLADGMIKDEPARSEYLTTLKHESERLARIVENVLDYARLGDRRRLRRAEPVAAGELIERLRPALERRAALCDMEIHVEETDAEAAVTGRMVGADAQTVERILLNLVDNACKYAASAADRRILIRIGPGGGGGLGGRGLEIAVIDHGPGIAATDDALIFHPFQRGRATDGSIPGLGLGLALARGLARELGGDLRLMPGRGIGAEFRLSLPTA